jgi:SAM-dependent methyltransferase
LISIIRVNLRLMLNDSYTHETYGECVADDYDNWYQDFDQDAIAMLAELTRDGRALELGIGTGRIALPLMARNVAVHGLDASPSMVAQMRAKPNGDRVPINFGNFADVAADGQFTLVYVVFNTFFALTSQEEQVRCFRNVAAHLTPDGCFLIEAFVPDVTRFDHGQTVWATNVTTENVDLDVGKHDPVTQRIVSQKVFLKDGSIRLYPLEIRYAWPSELDLMAQLAGLRLRERWSNWQRQSFTAESVKHISVYERAV